MNTTGINIKEVTYTFSEIAELLGVSVDEIIKVAIQEGLLDKNGSPTELAISEGLLTTETTIKVFQN